MTVYKKMKARIEELERLNGMIHAEKNIGRIKASQKSLFDGKYFFIQEISSGAIRGKSYAVIAKVKIGDKNTANFRVNGTIITSYYYTSKGKTIDRANNCAMRLETIFTKLLEKPEEKKEKELFDRI
jgi:hypothetical protein